MDKGEVVKERVLVIATSAADVDIFLTPSMAKGCSSRKHVRFLCWVRFPEVSTLDQLQGCMCVILFHTQRWPNEVLPLRCFLSLLPNYIHVYAIIMFYFCTLTRVVYCNRNTSQPQNTPLSSLPVGGESGRLLLFPHPATHRLME